MALTHPDFVTISELLYPIGACRSKGDVKTGEQGAERGARRAMVEYRR